MKKKRLVLFLIVLVGVFSFCNVLAATYSNSKKLSVTSSASASIMTKATYNTTGKGERWNYSSYDYKVNFTPTIGITMTKASWTTSGDDDVGWQSAKFTWGWKTYNLSDRNQTQINANTKTATYKYEYGSKVLTVK